MRRYARSVVLAATALSIAGCSLAPGYQRPALAALAVYKEAGPWQPAGSAVTTSGDWWQAFGDPVLNDLEGRIENGNFDLAAAAARYAEARAVARQADAARLPEVDVGAGASRDHASADRPLGGGNAATYNDYRVGASLSYEIDLFGRVRNNARAAGDRAEASAADLAAARLGLQAQLATIYFTMRELDARIALLNQTVASYQRAFDLTDTRHGGGIASGIDVSRSASQLSSARAELSAAAIDRARNEHAIAVLVGKAPADLTIPVATAETGAPAIPAGIPSTLLERRPDIAAAERRVAAANAQIGVARAALFPSVTLGAGGGFETTGASLLSAPSTFWALGPLQAALAIFDGGRRRAGVRIARAQYDEAAADYRGTVLTAFREVEDDLSSARLLAAQERDQAAASSAAERTRDLAMVRYHDGAADYLEVVIAQTAALDAERTLLAVRRQQLLVATDTYRALGGGYRS
ncbi:MAG: transporter [Sphingomonas bacterium]|uniref:efflux transporter outer membrane subunit n=1 Tax=Sphingomonas bacterium TaxID=1895847 RepID=UPI00262E058A|nr:efflux transporter outer membrane subunit [Sphingomonas bacterium]MDB5710144.1 transporter [Sphingomonas bacterium]